MRASLQQSIFGIAAIALIPAIGILAYNQIQLRQDRAAEINDMALRQATLASLEVERILDGVRSVLVVASVSGELRGSSSAACQSYLAEVAARVPGIDSMAVLASDGELLCSSTGGASNTLFPPRLLAAALASAELETGGYTVNPATGRSELPLAMAFRAAGGTTPFILTAAISLDWLGMRLKERGLASGGQLTLADSTGVILTRDPLPERFVGKRIPDRFLSLVTEEKPGAIEVTSQDGTERILGYVPAKVMPSGVYVSSGISKAEAFAPINRASAVGLALILLGALVAFPLSWLAGQLSIKQPVDRILAVVGAWKAGRLDQRTGFRADADELGAVGAALDAMADELKRRSEHTALLSRELSHRLKNTLAVVQAMAGQTFRDSADATARQAFSARLAALAASYAVLSRNEWQQGDLKDVLETTLAPHQDGGPPRFRYAGGPVPLDASLALAVSMIAHELATNAVKYGALGCDGGTVDIVWSRDGGRVRLEWREQDGLPVSAPQRTGFGTRLIENAIPAPYAPSVKVEMLPQGLRCTVSFRLGEGIAGGSV